MSNSSPSVKPLLVGVMPGQDDTVLNTALSMARALQTELILVYVDPAGFRVSGRRDDGGERFASIDPDPTDDDTRSARLQEQVAARLAQAGTAWRYQLARGEPAHELARAAYAAGALMIVVGARRPTPASRIENLLTGSVATQLAHHQPLPVLVVPAGSSSHHRAGA